MNGKRMIGALLCACLLAALLGCGSGEKPAQQKPGVVYLDPNAVKAAATKVPPAEEAEKATEAPGAQETSAPAKEQKPDREETAEEAEAPLDLYFEGKGVRIVPWMEAAPVLAALGDPIGTFEADSCAYIGKDLFYYYPGFELTVNQVEGVDRITAVTVADDTVVTPQGLRIYDEEEKLLSLLGGTEDNGVYTYRNGQIQLLVQVKDGTDDSRHIASMEYRIVEDQ